MQYKQSTNADDADVRRMAQLSQRLSGSLALCIGLVTAMRPFIVDLPPIFTQLGWFNFGLSALAFGLISSGKIDRYAPSLVMVIGAATLLPLLAISGGANSQFAVIVPLLPVWGVFVAGRRIGTLFGVLLIGLIIYDLSFGLPLSDLTVEAVSDSKSRSRSIWLIATIVMGIAFAYQLRASLQRLRQQLWDQANIDSLTGLANRRSLDRHLERELARSRRTGEEFSLLLIDVDHFKRVNDFQGHAAGDDCLVKIAQALTRGSRAGQDVVARFGGEEFVALLGATSAQQALKVAHTIKDRVVDLRIPYGDQSDSVVTVTIGCATFAPETDMSVESALQRADRALYEGKRRGRNRVVEAASIDAAKHP